MKLSTRVAAGALAVVLPVAAVAGCGTEKRRTVKAELAAASDHLKDSRALGVTLRLDDPKGTLDKLIGEDESNTSLRAAVLKGGISYVVDPAGDRTLRQVRTHGRTEAELKASLKAVNAAFLIRDDRSVLGELRLVAGTLYLHVDLPELNRLAEEAGQDPIDKDLDAAIQDEPTLQQAVTDVRAGKWVKLPLLDYIDRFRDLAEGFTGEGTEPMPTPSPLPDLTALGDRLWASVKPYVKVTDANDSSSDRVLDVNVRVRPAVKALLASLKADKSLPFGHELDKVNPAEVDKSVTGGTAHGTIRLADGHLKQIAVDLESLRTLDPEETSSKDSVAGSRIVVDVDDDAHEVAAPTNVSAFDLGDYVDTLLNGFEA